MKSTRDGFVRALLKLGENKNIYALTADYRESFGLTEFADKFPKRFIEVGIAEQNMMGIAAGLAFEDKIPFVTSAAVFSPGRNWDQLRVSVCLSNVGVKIIGGYAGVSNSKDGANAQGLEDIAITRVLPNLKVVIPADYTQAVKATLALAKDSSPIYMRISKEPVIDITDTNDTFVIGKAQILQEGADLTLVSAGPILADCLEAIEQVDKSVEVINLHTIKPIDTEAILASVSKTKKVITVEDHQIHGGLGSAVSEVLSTSGIKYTQRFIGINDTFTRSARSPDDLKALYKIDSRNIAKEIKSFLDLD